MELWPAWMIALFFFGGPLIAVVIHFVDNSIDSLLRPRKRRWTPIG